MDFLELVEKRYSVRKFEKTPVEKELLDKILEAGRLAPTSCNFQPFKILVITDEAKRQAMTGVYHQGWFADAPVIIGIFVDTTMTWKRADDKDYGDVDAAIVMDHMVLQATELGLGTCWIGAFDAQKARNILSLPENLEPVLFTPLGYPDAEKPPRKRKSIEDLVSYESF